MREILSRTREFIYDDENEMSEHIKEMEANNYYVQDKNFGRIYSEGKFHQTHIVVYARY